jgi:hypothetical protein
MPPAPLVPPRSTVGDDAAHDVDGRPRGEETSSATELPMELPLVLCEPMVDKGGGMREANAFPLAERDTSENEQLASAPEKRTGGSSASVSAVGHAGGSLARWSAEELLHRGESGCLSSTATRARDERSADERRMWRCTRPRETSAACCTRLRSRLRCLVRHRRTRRTLRSSRRRDGTLAQGALGPSP